MREVLPMKFSRPLPWSRSRLRPNLPAHQTGILFLCLVLLGMGVPMSYGAVESQNSDVTPANNPFTPTINEGLPTTGHSIDSARAANSTAQEDYNGGDGFEGRYDVLVGKSGFGSLLISGGDGIRAEHLIIGDSEEQPLGVEPWRDFVDEDPNQPLNQDVYDGVRGADLLQGDGTGLHGSGVVRIQGFPSFYNSQYTLLPPGIPGGYATFGSVREDDATTKGGFDLYVGRWGNGRLEIVAGGRAEIDDAIVVGDQGGSVGLIEVEGIDSFLGNAGSTGIIDGNIDAAGMSVGRLGSGTVNIIAGGQIYARGIAPAAGGNADDIVAAVIGGDLYDGTMPPEAGGVGNVYVDGVDSSWVLGGHLQIGGFHANHDPLSGDLEGKDVIYASNVGQGRLTVSNGALVSVIPPDQLTTGTAPNELDLLIGRLGTVDMQGGRIEMQGGFEPGGGTPDPLIDDVQIINDGTIMGYGEIYTGIFANRYLGRVEVGAGESLYIEANTLSQPPMHREPLVNWGVIEVRGTEDAPAEIEFDRTFDPVTADPSENTFKNLLLSSPPLGMPPGVYGGLISAQHATLRFPSGLNNQATMAFTAGSNYVEGHVTNAPTGIITLTSDFPNGVTAIFENTLTNAGGTISVGTNNLVVLGRNTFVTTGNLEITLDPLGSGIVDVAGDVALSGTLTAQLSGDLITTLSHGDVFELISFDGEAYGVDFTDPLNPIPDFSDPLPFGAPGFTEVSVPGLDILFPTLDPISRRIGQSFYLFFLDPSLVGLGAVGADFNGDGIVDNLDLDLIRTNFGIQMGASILQGDANGDGRVDGRDFFIWQDQVGGMGMPVPGAGGGAGASAVPEPSSLALALFGGLLALAASRRRTSSLSRG